MRRARSLIVAFSLLLIGACHSQSDTGALSNSVTDNTVGTVTDDMTNIDATTGSAANMAADVPAGAQSSDDGSDSAPTGADAGSGDASPAPKPAHHTKATTKPAAPKLDSNPGDAAN